MGEIRSWAIGLAVIASVGLATGVQAASFDDLVPGEMLSDGEVGGYFGKGTEGIDGGVNNNTGEIVQNNVDDFVANVDASTGSEQGFVNIFQVSGDNASVDVFIMIDVNINGVDFGATIVGSDVTGGAGDGMLSVTGTADVTASADIQHVFEATSLGLDP
jgi:hypothetical protein